MKLSEMVSSYAQNPRSQATLNKRIRVVNSYGKASILKKGTVSDLLIDRGDGEYHFEANNVACIVKSDEITIQG